ncbi:MAG: hypothetical protein ACXVBE_01110 [Bdellovibrionota bacterium]
MLAEKRENIRATIPVPDHSDLRGFTYRAPTNTQGYNDDPRTARAGTKLKGQLYHRKGFWTSVADFFRGKKEPAERPLSPGIVSRETPNAGNITSLESHEDFEYRPSTKRSLPQDRDSSNIWPG